MFRFSIRDVLWLMVVVGLGVSWRVDHARIDEAVAAVKEQGAKNDREAKLLREAAEDEWEMARETEKELQGKLQRVIRFRPQQQWRGLFDRG
jgi:hypothetical protein